MSLVEKARERERQRQLEYDEWTNKGWWDARLAEMKRCIETERCSILPAVYLSQSINHDKKTAAAIDKLQKLQSTELEKAVKEGLEGKYRQIHPFYAYCEYDDNSTFGWQVLPGQTGRHLAWLTDELREKAQAKLIEIFKKGEAMTADEKHYVYLVMAINIFAVDKLKESLEAIKTKKKKKIVSNHWEELVKISAAAKEPMSKELEEYFEAELKNTELAKLLRSEKGMWKKPKLPDGFVSQHGATNLPLVYDANPNAKEKMVEKLVSVCEQLGLYQFMVFRNPLSRMYGFGDADPIAKWKRDLTPDQMHANFLHEAGRRLKPAFQRRVRGLFAAFRGHGDQEDEKNEKDQNESVLFAPVKTAERMVEKSETMKSWMDQKIHSSPFCQYMLDILRCTVQLDDAKQIAQFYKVAKEALGDDLLFVSNDFAKEGKNDYRKLTLNARIVHPETKNLEMISEIQVTTKKIWGKSAMMHIYYNVERNAQNEPEAAARGIAKDFSKLADTQCIIKPKGGNVY
mmetsp:Transcript_10218/g.16457  ORF Transcript_10218/g.16457 Transcript_10218/m.16457 type:complete len:515 (-) Transcript_10218:222-1766(-)|eukprot:CAMPEP_0197026088 /NCGR_PEP_ID=MMETSP1384-20130603/6262_1 /TAXON_ID=29189 /ORGANISM="Ammonia sp." /LENGTH=514 /DNA_ID=CAMNT_0042454697 /DNA_START=77 /DNA_END=1621 /DNA_ORIENTATION=-